MTIDVGVTEDRRQAVIHLRQDGRAIGHIILDAATLDQHIRELAKIRGAMTKEVAPELEQN